MLCEKFCELVCLPAHGSIVQTSNSKHGLRTFYCYYHGLVTATKAVICMDGRCMSFQVQILLILFNIFIDFWAVTTTIPTLRTETVTE